jgi:hypothetical protein
LLLSQTHLVSRSPPSRHSPPSTLSPSIPLSHPHRNTHAPSLPLIPTGPSVRILRLAQPLAVHDSGALRLASLLDRAQRIAAAHPHSSSPPVIQLAEDGHNGPFTILEPYAAAEPSSPSHVSSPFSLPHEPSPAPSIASEASSSQSFFYSPSKRRHAKPTKKSNITRRPFDAIINCLPSGIPEKALLKHAILVTTLTAPFLATSPSFDSLRDNNKRSSFLRSTPDLEAPMPSAKVSTHIVHVLPRGFCLTSTSTSTQGAASGSSSAGSSSSSHPVHLPPKSPLRQPSVKNDAKPKLVQSIEQFLLAFGYPLHSISSDKKGKKIADAHPDTWVDQQKREIPVPYLVAPGILGYVLCLDGAGTQASLGEALLLGALDPIDDIGGGGKAWIGNGGEVVVDGDADTQVVLTLPPPVRTKSSRRKPERRRMSDKEVGMGLNGLLTPPESAEGSSRSNSSMESGYTSPSDEEAEVQGRLGRSASGRRGGGGGIRERLARRRSSRARRSAHVHAQNAPLQGRALAVPGRSRQERDDSSSHRRKPSLKKRTNPLSALLHSQKLSYQGLTHLKFWSRKEVRVGGVNH